MSVTKKIFLFSFIVSFVLLYIQFSKFSMYDFSMWANQASWVESGDPSQFDYLQAYGHPGGPIIEGVIALHRTGLSYDNSLMLFMLFFCSLAIAGSTSLCFALTKDNCWLIVLALLCINRMYDSSTPPSTTAALAIGFLALFSIYLYYQQKVHPVHIFFLSFVIGLTVSLRVDIGGFISLAMLVFLKSKISWKQLIYTSLGAGIFFVLLDPFMWFMPIQHVQDLWFKIAYHYDTFAPNKIDPWYLVNYSSFSLVSVLLSMVFVLGRKKIASPIPLKFIYIFIVSTTILCYVFLSANYQAPRYFLPIITVWQIVLPIFLFKLTQGLWPSLHRKITLSFTVLLILYPIILSGITYSVINSYHL